MTQDSGISGIAHVIQLSVAPVFLLSGIGAMLAVMTNRLARVIDRARHLEEKMAADPSTAGQRNPELETLSRRARQISRAIMLCTITALLVCGVIATLFIGSFFGFDASLPAAVLFVTAMIAFMSGLLLFVREILLATATLRIGHH